MRRLCWLVCLMILGCDRDGSSPPAPAKNPQAAGVEIGRVTPLPPDRPTHVASTASGQIFWVQEAQSGRETVFAMSEGGLPAATKFSNAAVLDALGQSAAGGSIQSLVAASNGKLYFYFSGGKGRQLLAAFGCFVPDSGTTQILADTAALSRDSGMGDSLTLARGSVIRVGDVLWLWLRHEDGYALLSLDVTRVGTAPRRPFEQVYGAGQAVRPTSGREDLAGAGNLLIYLDRQTGRLWKIEPLGETTMLHDIADLPKAVTPPSVDERGRLVMFAPDSERFVEPAQDALGRPVVKGPDFPALVILEGDKRTILARETLTAPARLNVRALAPPQLFRDRSGWLAYDPQSGELLRLRVMER
jgi:hypothetical protein